MKRTFKILGITIISIIAIYTIFIIEESIRTSNNMNSKPVIILNTEINNGNITYNSLGFKLTNKYGVVEDKKILIGQEFWLFDSFLIWAWIS